MPINLSSVSKPEVVQATGPILLTIATRERELFLPGISIDRIAGQPCVFFPSCETEEKAWWETLLETQPSVLITNWSSRPIPASFLDRADCPLRYVCHMTGTMRNLIPRSFLERGGIASNWGGLAARQVAEHALVLALSILRNLPDWRPYILKPRTPLDWAVVDVGSRSLFGRSVGIHGFGHVARTLVGLLKPFGVKIRAFSPGVSRSLFEEYDAEPCGSLAGLFSKSDLLFECEALTPQSEGSVTAAVLAKLPDNAVFVNVARGQIVCEEALLKEVESGRIRVGLDVLCDERNAATSPFMDLPNCIISPHIAGPTPDQFPALGRFAMDNVKRFLAGEVPEGLVTLELYDRTT